MGQVINKHFGDIPSEMERILKTCIYEVDEFSLAMNLQIAVKLAIGDARNHQEKICAIEHAELVARDATVFPQALMVTSRHALVMLASEPMEIDPSALKF